MANGTFSFDGSIPENYDRYLGPYLFEPFAIEIVDMIKGQPAKILEIAAGTGRVTKHLSNRFHTSTEIIATDINPNMLALAQQKIDASNVKWEIANAASLPFENDFFDCVICQFGYMFLQDKQQAINEAYRVLKPGGQFLFSTWDKIENNSTAQIAEQTVTEYMKNNPPTFYKLPFSMHEPAKLNLLLENAGFIKTKIQQVTKIGESPSAIDVATGFIEGNPVVTEISNKDIETLKQAIAAKIRENHGDNPVRTNLNVWICEANKAL